MKRLLLLTPIFLLAACSVDTTGLSKESSRLPHPDSNENSAIVVQEFADIQCPACKAAHIGIVKPLIEEQGSQIRYEFMHFPLSSIHRYALEAAQAAECAADQGKFWEFIDIAYENQEDLNSEQLNVWATELGLDFELFSRCLRSGIKKDLVLDEYSKGRDMGVRGTPTFFVNGNPVQSDPTALKEAIEAERDRLTQQL